TSGGAGGNGAARATGYYSSGGAGGGGGSGYLKNGAVGSTGVTLGTVTVSNKYVNTTVTQSSTSGANAGAGYIRITVLEVNQDPVTKTTVYTCGTSTTNRWARGDHALTVKPSDIATDLDTGLSTSAAAKTLYFSNNDTSDLSAWSSCGLWLDKDCKNWADSYVDYRNASNNMWVYSNSEVRIKKILKYPRKNVDGCTEDGKLRVYTKVRDNYGETQSNANTHRGYAVVYFDIYVSPDVVKPAVATTLNSGTTSEIRLGKSNQTNTTLDYRDTSSYIYNTTNNRDTAFIAAPLNSAISGGVTLDATKLFRVLQKGTENNASPTVSAYDVVGISKVTNEAGTSNVTSGDYYTITFNTNTTTYGSSGLYPSITIKPKSSVPPVNQFVTLRLYAKACEKASKAAIGDEAFIYLTFYIGNTRPYYVSADKISKISGTSSLTEPNYTLTVGQTKDIYISDLVRDRDGHTVTYVTGTSSSNIKVPANEYIPVTKQNAALTLKSTSNYYNLTGNTVVGGANTGNAASSNSWYTGTGAATTGFGSNNPILAPTGTAAASTACVTYTYVNNNTLRLTARAATQFQYDRTKYSSTATTGLRQRNGDFYFMVRLQDSGDTADSGIWVPISIKVTDNTPEKLTPTANFTLGFDYAAGTVDAQGTPTNDATSSQIAQYITPISFYDTRGTLNGIGAYDQTNYLQANKQAQPFVKDADTFAFSSSYGADSANIYTYALNDFAAIDSTSAITVGNGASYTINTYDTEAFFKVETVDLYASGSVFAYLRENNRMTQAELTAMGINVVAGSNPTRYVYKGLKITPVRSTGDKFFQIDVKVVDTHGSKATVPVYIKVENRAVNLRRAPGATNEDSSNSLYAVGLKSGVSEYKPYEAGIGSCYISYKTEVGGKIKITPYDFAYDFDVANGATDSTANYSLPYADDSDFASRSAIITATHAVKSVSAATDASPSNTTNVTCQTLSFTDYSDISSKVNQDTGAYRDYLKIETSSTVQTVSGIPTITFTAKSRTGAENVQFSFLVGDGSSAVRCTITITVNNGAPELQSGLQPYYSLTAGTASGSLPNAWEFSINGVSSGSTTIPGIVKDKDGDSPTFISGTAKIVAKVGDEYYPALNASYGGVSDVTDASAKYILSSYATATLTKSTQSGAMGTDVIRVVGLSSTQTLPVPVYLEFQVTDNYDADEKRPTLHIQIEVINSKPQADFEALVKDNTLIKNDDDSYTWQIKYEQQVEKGLARYIVSSSELASSSMIPASAKNKIVLFSDADGLQLPQLSPATEAASFNAGNYVTRASVAYDAANLKYGKITSDMFESRASAAIMYTPMYKNTDEDNEKGLSEYLDITVQFFRKTDEGFENAAYATEYWAIKIVENSLTGRAKDTNNGLSTQIAIAICDDHHNASTYTGGTHEEDAVTGNTEVRILNFYYQYKSPGLIATHETYRNDPVSESAVAVEKRVAEDPTLYSIDYDYLYGYQFESGNKPAAGTDKQTAVRNATYSEDFQYQYFVNSAIYATGEGSNREETPVSRPKTFDSTGASTFYYKPVEVGATGSTTMPISYIAMPKTFSITTGGGTVNGNHVTFANAGAAVGGDVKLVDSEYATWGATNADVFANLALTDGNKTWSGADILSNPYVNITYTGSVPFNCELINKAYAQLSDNAYVYQTMSTLNPTYGSAASSIFQEDKFGFVISKKSNGERPAGNGTTEFPVGTLKLFVDLKTFDSSSNAETEATTVSVKISVANSRPSFSQTEIDMKMTVANASGVVANGSKNTIYGKYVEFYRGSGTNIAEIDSDFKTTIQYSDADSKDEVVFYLPSATDSTLGSVLTEEQIEYINLDTNIGSQAAYVTTYFTDIEGTVASDLTAKKAFIPNPGYKQFFTVSPDNGTSNILQFKPVAKTQLNLNGKSGTEKEAILKSYNLKQDSDGKIYYPFKVLSYDDLNNSGFGNGGCGWALTVINVYIDNDPISVDTSKIDNKNLTNIPTITVGADSVKVYTRTVTLSKGSPISLDVSTILKDADMQYNGSAYALKTDASYTNLTDDGKYVKDYLEVPQTVDVTENEVTKKVPTASESSGPYTSVSVSAVGTSYAFEAISAFKTDASLTYVFEDTAGSKVAIKFVLKYTNETPNLHSVFGNDSIDIVMHTGDSFVLHVAEVGEKATYTDTTNTRYTYGQEYYFGSDMNGGYSSPSGFTAAAKASGWSYPMTATAQDLYGNFSLFGTSGSTDTGTELILFDDDAPSTLRFQNNGSFMNTSTQVNSQGYFTVEPLNTVRTEQVLSGSGTTTRAMSLRITAKGVANTPYTVTVVDDGTEYSATLNITVLPTAPTPITDTTKLSAIGLTPVTGADVDPNTYSLSLKYGETFDKPLRYDSGKTGADNGFITDVDSGDAYNLSIPAVYGGDAFSVVNPEDSTAVSARTYLSNSANRIAISADDLITDKDDYAVVTFRVSDAHGAMSDEIHIRVYVTPEDIDVRATKALASTTNLISLKSYAEFYDDGLPTVIDLVSDDTATTLVYDKSFAATSSSYDVRIYALLKDTDGEIVSADENAIDRNDALILECLQPRNEDGSPVAGSITTPSSTSVQQFVNKYFTVSITSDGKALTFYPNSASINPIDTIRFFIEIGKRYDWDDDGEDKFVLSTKSAYMNVSVANSAPVAVIESVDNYGYPHTDITDDEPNGVARDDGFLTFVGTAGDELTWALSDDTNINRGLFYDYDAINTGYASSGDKISYVDYSYSINEGSFGGQTYEQRNGKILDVKYDKGNVTIKILRKARVSQPSATTPSPTYVDIPVTIRCTDTLGNKASPRVYSSTVINVRVENDRPEFKEVAADANLGYTISYNEDFGEYFMEAAIATDKALTVNLRDILTDSDIAIDVYYFNATGDSDALSETTTAIGNSEDRNMFSFGTVTTSNDFQISTMSAFTFRCRSNDRGATAVCTLKIMDSTGRDGLTSKMTITLTVDNTAPRQSVNDIVITVMGLAPTAEAPDDPSYVGNIIDYVSDINPNDRVNVTPDNRPENYVSPSNTYINISKINVNRTDGSGDKPFIYGSGVVEPDPNDDKVLVTTSVCDVVWAEYDTHQTFGIMLTPGVYGTQPVTFEVRDDGYNDGVRADVIDGLTATVNVKIIVMRPIDDIELPSFDIAYKVKRTVTPELLLNTEDEEHNADGYVITGIESKNDALIISSEAPEAQTSAYGGISASANETRWFITADKMSSEAAVTVTFGVSGGSVQRDIAINVTENRAPVMRAEASGVFTTADLDDNNMITIEPGKWFTDPDIDDQMRFVSPLKVKIGAYAEAHLDGNNIVLKFLGRGETELTFNIGDMSGKLYSHTITIGCNDMAELSFFGKALAMVQSNPLMYGLIAGGVLLFIIILIIIIIVVHKKRKMRAEIEALLESETEMEEEMMRLSGGAMQYQSYGYLPPTTRTMNDPGLMLGSAANNPTPNNLQLNAGTGQVPPQASTPQAVAPQPSAPQSAPVNPAGSQSVNPADNFDPNDF
ncbi:MAG: hypothetical protein NC184_03010, partial [Roseburia sp.]|nr:hypothetical protein [Roseburia sp.]